MTEEIDMAINEFKSSNEDSLVHLQSELRKLRTGMATPDMLSNVFVDYYGSRVPLSQVANVGSLDGRTLTVQPWEKALLDECSRGIINANLGLAPQNNGEMLIINIPMLTEERRKDLVKLTKVEGENAKVSIRNNRKDAMDFIKDLKNDGLSEDEAKIAEERVQEVTNTFSKKVDDLLVAKEKDIMTI